MYCIPITKPLLPSCYLNNTHVYPHDHLIWMLCGCQHHRVRGCDGDDESFCPIPSIRWIKWFYTDFNRVNSDLGSRLSRYHMDVFNHPSYLVFELYPDWGLCMCDIRCVPLVIDSIRGRPSITVAFLTVINYKKYTWRFEVIIYSTWLTYLKSRLLFLEIELNNSLPDCI